MTETDVDWSSIPGDRWYQPERVVPAFAEVRAGSDAAAKAMLVAVANNHSGELFPAAFHAVQILLHIATHDRNVNARAASLAILDDILWFYPGLPPFDTADVDGEATPLDVAIHQLVREAIPTLRSTSSVDSVSCMIESLAESLTQREE